MVLSLVVGLGPSETPQGVCEELDANGTPLFDSQFRERTGHEPCEGARSSGRQPGQHPAEGHQLSAPGDARRLYRRAAATCPGLPWEILGAIAEVESRHGQDRRTSSAGALGPMQFLPSTWAAYGLDADLDGRANVHDPEDAVHGAAHLLCATGGGDPRRLPEAIFQYNPSREYVGQILALAGRYEEERRT